MTNQKQQTAQINLCKGCHCMTKTIKDRCGKCGYMKMDKQQTAKEKANEYLGVYTNLLNEEEKIIFRAGVSAERIKQQKQHEAKLKECQKLIASEHIRTIRMIREWIISKYGYHNVSKEHLKEFDEAFPK